MTITTIIIATIATTTTTTLSYYYYFYYFFATTAIRLTQRVRCILPPPLPLLILIPSLLPLPSQLLPPPQRCIRWLTSICLCRVRFATDWTTSLTKQFHPPRKETLVKSTVLTWMAMYTGRTPPSFSSSISQTPYIHTYIHTYIHILTITASLLDREGWWTICWEPRGSTPW